ncbi:MAG TPA: hypothetical protein VGY99_24265 [Candidatus Binataceae bacterium]|jgi:type II secretory pathway component GspD/PulD (secretin)|nr:hypothetical protein [Candidatus Binataceae bacterium]
MAGRDARLTEMRLFFSLLLIAVLTGLEPAVFAGEPQTGSKQNLITMNFDNVDISVLAKFISEITGKNFVLDESVRGKVTIFAPAKVTRAQAYCIFESALQVKGFATVAAGPVIKIMPSRDARAWASLTHSQTPAGQCAQPLAPKGTGLRPSTNPEAINRGPILGGCARVRVQGTVANANCGPFAHTIGSRPPRACSV